MMKLHKYHPDKVKAWPGILAQPKLDGVCGIFDRKGFCVSRAGKPIPSAYGLVKATGPFRKVFGELLVMDVPDFARAAGVIRRKQPDPSIFVTLFDGECQHGGEHYGWRRRLLAQEYPLDTLIEQHELHTANAAEGFAAAQIEAGGEGAVLWNPAGLYVEGKRSWDVLKLKAEETLDLKVVSMEMADATAGVQTDMLGRFICVDSKGNAISVGPGKLTHDQRRALWRTGQNEHGQMIDLDGWIIEVKGMPGAGAGYAVIRQPIFQRFRWDKTEIN